ncbi:death-associated protein kinase related isoform X1 [Halyomorpha halys]|uniref:death-associated protein kinase related isoform X1 n=1 Tax=Halyomorpha halys TaxID=286706 RepID=UPI0034D2FDA8
MKQTNGVNKNKTQNGLLCFDEESLNGIIKTEPITDVYDVEHTPFARYVALCINLPYCFLRGKFAAVRKLVHKVTGVAYAGKFIRKRRRSMDQRDEILHEVAVLRLCDDSHRIVRLVEVYETSTEMALVLELAAGGELQRVVDVQDGLEEMEAVTVMRQVLEALVFLHDHNIAHLDLKPQNMLLTRDYPDTDIILCDFGISRVIQDGIEVREILGTPDYVAPEVLSYEPISLSTDIWSVGVLAYVLLTGYSPFAGSNKQETFCNISQCALTFPDELFSGVSSSAIHFIQSTLVVDPRCRLTALECLSHPWMSGATIREVPFTITECLPCCSKCGPACQHQPSVAVTPDNRAMIC